MKKHLEDDLTIAVANYIKMQYPSVLFTHIPNGGKRNAREGARLKKMGVKKGIVDLLIFVPKIFGGRIISTGLYVELKIEPNRATPEQIEVMDKLKKAYWTGDVCYDFDSAKKLIDEYLR